MENKKIAIVRVRGSNKIKGDIEDTMKMLRLYKKNGCIIAANTSSIIGMINKVKDYITWGEIDQETFRLLLEKRGKIVGNKPLNEEYLKNKCKMDYGQFTKEFFELKKNLRDVPGLKQYFKLKPPKGGFERYGIKKPFSVGGALGYRSTKINELIQRMIWYD